MIDERSMPSAVETERALLGGLILNPDELAKVIEVLVPEDYYRPEHGMLHRLLLLMARDGDHVDLVTLTERILRGGLAERYGGSSYVAELPEHCPATTNLAFYAEIIRDHSKRRQLIELGTAAVTRAYNAEPPGDIATALSDAGMIVQRGIAKLPGTGAVIHEVVDDIHEIRSSGKPPALSTGLLALDEILGGGLRPTNLTVLAGRPAMGKTAAAMAVTRACVEGRGKVCGWISLEMSRKQLMQRLLSMVAEIPMPYLRDPRLLTDEQVQTIETWEPIIAGWRILIDDRASLNIADVRARVRQWRLEHGEDLEVVVLDYLQLASGTQPGATQFDIATEIPTGAKGIAKDYDLSFVLLSQLNRDCEKRADKRPMPSDLRASGQIEQDADEILFLYRDVVYNPTVADPAAAEIGVAKQRNGPTGTVHLRFDGDLTRFRDPGLYDPL